MVQCQMVTLGFNTFDNFVNEFIIKVENLIAQCDREVPLEINVLFPKSSLEQMYKFGYEYIKFILKYLYVMKIGGHSGSEIKIGFLENK